MVTRTRPTGVALVTECVISNPNLISAENSFDAAIQMTGDG